MHGVKQDYVKAYAWLSLAIEQNFTPAEADKESITKNMSPEEISAGKLLADRLRKSKIGIWHVSPYYLNYNGTLLL